MATNNKNANRLIELIKNIKTFDQLYKITSQLSKNEKGYLFEYL